jgi:hypothetical protein
MYYAADVCFVLEIPRGGSQNMLYIKKIQYIRRLTDERIGNRGTYGTHGCSAGRG